MDYFPLYDDRLVLAAPNNEHYRMLRERGVYGRELLLEEPFVSREEGSGTDTSLQNYLRTLGLSHDMLHVVARVDDPEAIKQMVSGGVGVAVPSRWTKARSSARSISSRSNRSSSPAWSKSSSTF